MINRICIMTSCLTHPLCILRGMSPLFTANCLIKSDIALVWYWFFHIYIYMMYMEPPKSLGMTVPLGRVWCIAGIGLSCLLSVVTWCMGTWCERLAAFIMQWNQNLLSNQFLQLNVEENHQWLQSLHYVLIWLIGFGNIWWNVGQLYKVFKIHLNDQYI